MARGEIADFEAKLFEEKRPGCLGVLVGPRKVGEIDYERYEDGRAKLTIRLRGARLPEGARRVTVLVNQVVVTDLELTSGSGHVRLDTAGGDAVPEVTASDTAVVRVGDVTICTGTFHRD